MRSRDRARAPFRRSRGLDPETRKKLEEAITILRGLSKQVPGLR